MLCFALPHSHVRQCTPFCLTSLPCSAVHASFAHDSTHNTLRSGARQNLPTFGRGALYDSINLKVVKPGPFYTPCSFPDNPQFFTFKNISPLNLNAPSGKFSYALSKVANFNFSFFTPPPYYNDWSEQELELYSSERLLIIFL